MLHHQFASSRPVVLLPHQASWTSEFTEMARRIDDITDDTVLHIDHIGSTAVPSLTAKDVIDVQLTVADLADTTALINSLEEAGFRPKKSFEYDEFHGLPSQSPELRKRYIREPLGERRAHIHVREAGRFNTRYALLFRDYLRANANAREEYELVKCRAAKLFPNSIEGYLFLKEPAFHLIYYAADLWAEKVGWEPHTEKSRGSD
ncbi:GrpB family protein [Hymenobacter sp. BT188]|uniref:GrpB family protein n=1 Tax=Hymenobacter sp. BT188 TaxID=2763504 RepID=UPI0016517133|nr:GrpB family protein [Hymenobacter sp. BT188]MBC6606635.1 GrpB family protein [Hymenobacter sp. BT188]